MQASTGSRSLKHGHYPPACLYRRMSATELFSSYSFDNLGLNLLDFGCHMKMYSEINSSGTDKTECESNLALTLPAMSLRLSRMKFLLLSLIMVLGSWSTARADL